jgi:hypothetical protein
MPRYLSSIQRVVTSIVLLACAGPGFGQQESLQIAADRKTATIKRAEQAPTIDGQLDEALWQTATVIEGLRQILPVENGTPSEHSEFRVAYDDKNFYIAAKLASSDPEKIVRRQLIQDNEVLSDDHIEIYLDPRDSRRGGYVFYLNPNSVRHDGLVFGELERAGFNMNWDGIWQGRATVTDSGWTAEISIPFSTLDFDPSHPDWGLNLVRFIGHNRETIGWSQRDQSATIDSYGLVKGFVGINQGLGLDVIPSVSFSDEYDFVTNGDDFTVKPSLDLFYRVTPSLTAAATINTDFSATEVDDRQVNLTRFSLFFPEKRDFFLQSADIFEFSNLTSTGRPFFSRTIGLSASGEPVDLIAGAKLAGRVGRWNIGLLGVQQDEFEGVEEKSLIVARVSANVLEQSTLGMIVTSGDPSSNDDNTLVGVDFNYKNTTLLKGQSLESRAWFQESNTPGLDGGDSAFGLNVSLPNDSIDARLGIVQFQENFNPAMGFISRTGFRAFDGHIRKRWRFENKALRLFDARISTIYLTDTHGRLETAAIRLIPFLVENHRGDKLSVEVIRRNELLVDDFEIISGVTIPAGRYKFVRKRFIVSSSTSRPLAFSLRFEGGSFYDGERFDTVAGITWKPGRHFFLDLDYTTNEIDVPDGKFTTQLLALKASIALNSRWSWINTLQHDNLSDRLGVNSRLRFSPRDGQEAYLVLIHDFLVLDDTMNARSGLQEFESSFRSLTMKISYNFRF